MNSKQKEIAFWVSILLIVLIILLILFTPVAYLLPSGLYLSLPLTLLIIAIIALISKKPSRVGFLSIFIILCVIIGPIFIFEGFIHNQGMGNIEYTVTVTGLEGRNSGGIGEVVVPLPMQNGESLIQPEAIDGQTFGDWRAVLVGFPDTNEEMLAFRHVGTNQTDIRAEFYQYLPDGLVVDDTNKVYLSPALDGLEPLRMAGRSAFSSEVPSEYRYRSVVSLSDNPESISHPVPDEIQFRIELKIFTGKTGFMTRWVDYRFLINESVHLENAGLIPVNVSVRALY